jgi:hypothetical protein
MEKIDRLGWAAGIALVSHGVSVGVRSNDADALAGLVGRLPPGWRPAGSPRVERLYSLHVGNGPGRGIRRFSLLYQDEMKLARSLDTPAVLRTLEAEIQLYLAERARGRIFVHAGVVAGAEGAMLIPGPSMSGKSTLVAALVGAGARYYSDEYAVLDSQGRVHEYRRPLTLRDDVAGAASALPSMAPDEVAEPLPVRLVLITQYRQGARWRPARLSPGRAAVELLAHTVAARWRPARALSTIARSVAAAFVLKGIRGEAADLVAALAVRGWPSRLAG